MLVINAVIAYNDDSTAPFAEQAEMTITIIYFGVLRVLKVLLLVLRHSASNFYDTLSARHFSAILGPKLQIHFYLSVRIFCRYDWRDWSIYNVKDVVRLKKSRSYISGE